MVSPNQEAPQRLSFFARQITHNMLFRSFIGQAPFFLVAFFLCWAFLPNTSPKQISKSHQESGTSKLARIDFVGSFFFAAFILLFLLPVEIGGVKIPWTHPLIPILLGGAAVSLVLFIVVEKRWAKEPILPLEMFSKFEIITSFVIMALQVAAQTGVSHCPTVISYRIDQKVLTCFAILSLCSASLFTFRSPLVFLIQRLEPICSLRLQVMPSVVF